MRSNVYEERYLRLPQGDYRSFKEDLLLKANQKLSFIVAIKTFIKIFFNETVKNGISLPNLSFEKIFEIFQSTLDYFAPYNQKKIKYNNNDEITLL